MKGCRNPTIRVKEDLSKNVVKHNILNFPTQQEATAHGKRAIKNYILMLAT